jgi:DNA-binding transcriptional MerR regulator
MKATALATNDAAPPVLITTDEFAGIARCSPSTVRYWRHMGTGPQGFKVGRRVVYDRGEVVRWLQALREHANGDGGRAA